MESNLVSRWGRGAVLSLSLGLFGCFNSGIEPRTADLVPKGKLGAGVSYTVVTVEPGTFTRPDGEETSGNAGKRWSVTSLPPLFVGYIFTNTQASFRYGLFDALELDIVLGLQQLGGELRLGLLDEDKRAPLSVALGAAAMLRPFTPGLKEPWSRLQLDISRRLGAFVPLFNVGLSFGRENHAVAFERDPKSPCPSIFSPGCSILSPAPYFIAVRRELRSYAALGVAFVDRAKSASSLTPNGGQFILALVPYTTLWSKMLMLDCHPCSSGIPRDFQADWGVSLVLGGAFVPP